MNWMRMPLHRPGPTAIVGTHAVAVARLRADADSGVDRVMLGHGNHMDLETVRIIGSEVALQV